MLVDLRILAFDSLFSLIIGLYFLEFLGFSIVGVESVSLVYRPMKYSKHFIVRDLDSKAILLLTI